MSEYVGRVNRFLLLEPEVKTKARPDASRRRDLLTGKPSNVKGWKDKYFLFTSNWLRREDPRCGEEFTILYRKFRKFKKG